MYDMTADLARIDEVVAQGPFQDSWESLSGYIVPEWYRRAKFGIFIHWGVFSVPAFGNEWYSRNMYIQGSREFEHHRKTWGEQKDFGYKDFIPLFKAERFDPEGWAELFKAAGAGYVVPVAEHHDGFQMYKSKLSHFNAFEMGPRRDVLGELKRACESRGLIFGTSSHRAEHWFFMGHGKQFDSDIKEPLRRGDFYWPAQPEPEDHFDLFSTPAPDREFLDDWLVRTCELIDAYQPRLIYFDWWIQHSAFKSHLQKLTAYYYDRAAGWGTGAVVNYKQDGFLFGAAVPDVERGQLAQAKPYYWQTDTSTALNSWCYTPDNVFRTPQELVQDLVDIVSKNGNLLLNVGPRADGSICEEDVAILKGIGGWLAVNGEAIYGAKPYRAWGEGPTEIVEGQFSDNVKKGFTSQDIRFTVAGGSLYATALKCADDGRYLIRTLGAGDPSKGLCFHGIIDDVTVLGCEEKPRWERMEEGLLIETAMRTDYPVVFKIKLR